MSYAAKQQIPVAPMACVLSANALRDSAVISSSNVATLEWTVAEGLPTQCSNLFAFGMGKDIPVESAGLALRTLARIALPDSRPMQDWEKEDADEFFWSQFA